jgi:hypothetical protein
VLRRAQKDALPRASALPTARHPEPEWVRRWRRARAAGDFRHFPEQADVGYAHAQESGRTKPFAGVAELELGSFRDRDVWVQPDEYLVDGPELGPAPAARETPADVLDVLRWTDAST